MQITRRAATRFRSSFPPVHVNNVRGGHPAGTHPASCAGYSRLQTEQALVRLPSAPFLRPLVYLIDMRGCATPLGTWRECQEYKVHTDMERQTTAKEELTESCRSCSSGQASRGGRSLPHWSHPYGALRQCLVQQLHRHGGTFSSLSQWAWREETVW